MSLSKKQKKSKGRENAKRSRESHMLNPRCTIVAAFQFWLLRISRRPRRWSQKYQTCKASPPASMPIVRSDLRIIFESYHKRHLRNLFNRKCSDSDWFGLLGYNLYVLKSVPCDGALPPRIRVELEKTSFSKTMDCFCLSGKIHFPPKQLIMRW